jgi:hypothetical protein
MASTHTAAVKEQDGWRIEEIPGVNCQERSRAELLDSLRVTLKEAMERGHPTHRAGEPTLWARPHPG